MYSTICTTARDRGKQRNRERGRGEEWNRGEITNMCHAAICSTARARDKERDTSIAYTQEQSTSICSTAGDRCKQRGITKEGQKQHRMAWTPQPQA